MAFQNKHQRVGVFIDVQNLYYSARQMYNAKVNFREIILQAVGKRSLIRAIAYCIKADIKDEHTFFDTLEKIGIEVKAKDIQIFPGGAKKGDWDIGIAMDSIELAPKLDVIVLVSGDGDFCPLVRHLKYAMGCRVEVIAFGRTSSAKLREDADSFFDLDKSKQKFLMPIKTRHAQKQKKDVQNNPKEATV